MKIGQAEATENEGYGLECIGTVSDWSWQGADLQIRTLNSHKVPVAGIAVLGNLWQLSNGKLSVIFRSEISEVDPRLSGCVAICRK